MPPQAKAELIQLAPGLVLKVKGLICRPSRPSGMARMRSRFFVLQFSAPLRSPGILIDLEAAPI